MAATQYQIFCKYLNEDTNKIVNNSSDKEWVSAQDWYQSKVAYNVTDKEATNAMTLAVDSPNTDVKQGETYRTLYEAIKVKMEAYDPITKRRLRFDDLSVEEKKAYSLCHRYLEILDMIANNKCVIEYAMIRPRDELIAVPPITTMATESTSAKTDFHHGGYTQYTVQSGSGANVKRYQPTTTKALLSNAKLLDNDLSKIIYEQLDVAANEKYNMLFTFAGMIQTDEQLDGWLYDGSLHQINGYRFFPDDNVLEYVSNHWHGTISTLPGEVYEIGSPPVKSFNTTPNVPSVSGVTSITVRDVSFSECEMEICNAVYEGMERLQIQPWFLVATCNSLRAALTKIEQLIDIYGRDAVKLGKVVPLDQYIEIV